MPVSAAAMTINQMSGDLKQIVADVKAGKGTLGADRTGAAPLVVVPATINAHGVLRSHTVLGMPPVRWRLLAPRHTGSRFPLEGMEALSRRTSFHK